MRKLNYFLSIILVVLMPLMIVSLSSNLILRISATYSFHFNDSEVMREIPYSVAGSTMADEISSYWSSVSKKPFQVYEDNRIFKDPVFEKNEQAVMHRAKTIINIELAAGILALAGGLAIYIYLLKMGFKKALRNRYRIGTALSILLLAGQAVFWCLKPCRLWIYKKLIGIPLGRDSILATILGDPFYRTYVIFATLVGGILLAVISYAHYTLTKPERIFY